MKKGTNMSLLAAGIDPSTAIDPDGIIKFIDDVTETVDHAPPGSVIMDATYQDTDEEEVILQKIRLPSKDVVTIRYTMAEIGEHLADFIRKRVAHQFTSIRKGKNPDPEEYVEEEDEAK